MGGGGGGGFQSFQSFSSGGMGGGMMSGSSVSTQTYIENGKRVTRQEKTTVDRNG